MTSIKVGIRESYERLENSDYKIISTSYGNVQYSVRNGEGIPVLIVHGIVGGYDQAIQTGIGLVGEHQTLIGVSRFGYLKSDLYKEPTPENQAHLYAEILKTLNFDEVFLLATSAGGTPALKFAILYPDKVKGIILVGSAAPDIKKSKKTYGPPSFIYNDFLFSLMINKMESMMFSMFGITKEQFNNASTSDKEELKMLLKMVLPIKPRKLGILNDERITNPDMNLNSDKYPFERIEVPFLVLHAKDDPMAKHENMKEMVRLLKNVEFKEYDIGGHILFGHGDENRKLINDFISKNS